MSEKLNLSKFNNNFSKIQNRFLSINLTPMAREKNQHRVVRVELIKIATKFDGYNGCSTLFTIESGAIFKPNFKFDFKHDCMKL